MEESPSQHSNRGETSLCTYPALVADTLRPGAADANANNMGRRVVEALGQANKLLVAHLLDELIDGHCVDKLVVCNGGAVAQGDDLVLGINLGDLALLAVPLLLLGERVGDGNPDATSSVSGREAESVVGAPVAGNLVQNDVPDDGLDIRGSDTLSQPLTLHLGPV